MPADGLRCEEQVDSRGADDASSGAAGEDAAERSHGPGRWKRAMFAMADDRALSSRELDVFEMLLKGYAKQRIAEELFIAYNTVRSHVRSIYAKSDAHSQQDLIIQFERDYLSKNL